MRLYIIRHGQTPWNLEYRMQGRTDIPLNENGRELARRTAKGMADIPFDLAFTSPLARAKETALLVLNGREIPLIEEERLCEVCFGEMEGTRFDKVEGRIKSEEFADFFYAPERYTPPKGGETIEELLARTGAFLDELKARKELQNQTILVSTHGAASRALLLNIRHGQKKDFWGTGVPKNCAVSIVELQDGDWRIIEQDVVFA